MKWIAVIAAGLVATASVTSAPAQAQPRGPDRHWNDGRWDRRGPDRHWNDRRWDDRRDWRGNRGWRGDRGWRGARHWNGRGRVTCRWVRGFHGPEQRCFRR